MSDNFFQKIESHASNKSIYDLSFQDKMELLEMGVRSVIRNYKMAALFVGLAGIGKTKRVIDVLEAEECDYRHIQGGIKNARALYQLLYDNNIENRVLIADDCNDIFRDKQAVEILRAATTNDKIRKVTFIDNKIAKGNRKYSTELSLKAKIIVITNIPLSKIDKAIISRTAPIEIVVEKEELLQDIKKNIVEAPPTYVDVKKKEEVFSFIKQLLINKEVARLDYRIFEQCCIYRATDDSRWKKFVYAYIT